MERDLFQEAGIDFRPVVERDLFEEAGIEFKPATRNPLAVANDTVIEAANAIAGGVGSVANFVSPGNRVSRFIDENIIKPGEQSQSDAVKQSKQRFRSDIASADGLMDEAKIAAKYAVSNPLLSAAQAAGSFALPLGAVKAAGSGAKALGLGASTTQKAALGGGAAAGAALSGGDAAGTAYELSKQGGATEEQAVEAARQASVVPAIVGAAGGLVGAERLVAGAKGFTGNVASRAIKTGAVEATQEGFEEGITQYEGQRAAVPYNPGLDPMKGVGAAATTGAILGAATGGTMAALTPQNAVSFTPPNSPTAQAGLPEIVVPIVPSKEQTNVSTRDALGPLVAQSGQPVGDKPSPSVGAERSGNDAGRGELGGSPGGMGGLDGQAAPVRDTTSEQAAPIERAANPLVRASDADLLARVTAQVEQAQPIQAQPVTIWTGRAGDGYADMEAAKAGLQTRIKREPELRWEVEQMPSGKYRLAGYEQNPGNTPTNTALPRPNADVSKNPQNFDTSPQPVQNSPEFVQVQQVVPSAAPEKTSRKSTKQSATFSDIEFGQAGNRAAWQMTRAEYIAQQPPAYREMVANGHAVEVARAVERGYDVPSSVLADYPALQKAKQESSPPPPAPKPLDMRLIPMPKRAQYADAIAEGGAPAQAPVLTDKPDGTLAVTGDPKALKQQLINAGIPSQSIMKSKTGVLIGRSQVAKVREFFAPQNVQSSIDGANAPRDTGSYEPASQAHRDAAAAVRNSLNAQQSSGGGRQPIVWDAVAPPAGAAGQSQRTIADAAKRLTGADVVWVKFADRQLFNGATSRLTPGKIFINVDTKKPFVAVLGHELLHHMARTQPGIYADLSSSLDGLIKNRSVYAQRLIAKYKSQGLTIADSATLEELHGDIVGDNFVDPEFWAAVAEGQPKLFQRIANAVIKWLDGLAEKLGGNRPFGTDEFLTDINAARNAVAQAFRQFSGAEVGAVTDGADGNDTQLAIAYHGSPHRFDKFTLDKIGTGEGAQAYGYGLYFTDRKEIAEHYRQTLATTVSVDGKPILKNNKIVGSTGDKDLDSMLIAANGDLDAAIGDAEKYLKEAEKEFPHAADEALKDLEKLMALQGRVDTATVGQLYEVEIPEDTEMLLFDSPLAKQPSITKAALFESSPDGISGYAKTLRDGVEGEPFRSKGYGGLDVPSKRSMLRAMFLAGQDSQVLKSIVGLVPVDVVNILSRRQLSVKGLFNDQSVLFDLFSIGSNNDVSLPVNSATAILKAVASAATEQSRTLSDLAGLSTERGAAKGTGISNMHAAIIEEMGQEATGSGFYKELSRRLGSDKSASEYLAGLGIRGIKYLDGSSRGAGDGSYNYVIFSDDDIAITARLSSNGSKQAATDKYKANSLIRHAEFLSDINKAPAFVQHGFSSLDIPSKRMVLHRVSAVAQDLQVFKSIVKAIPVDVVDVLTRHELTPEVALNDEAVLFDLFSINGNKPISLGADAANRTMRVIADAAAKNINPSSYRRRLPIDGGPAVVASKNGHTTIINGVFDDADVQIEKTYFSIAAPQGQRFTLPEDGATAITRIKLQDDALRMKRVIDAVKEQGGIVGEEQNFYDANTLMPGRVQAMMDDFRSDAILPMLKKAAKAGISMDELSLYAYARHAEERNAYIASINPKMPDGGSGMTNADARAILAEFEKSGKSAEYEDLHGDLMGIAATTRRTMLDEGLITQEQHDAMESQYENYIPLRGFENVDAETGAIRPGTGRGINVRGKETIRALGRRSRAGDLIENVIRDYQRAVVKAEKNNVAKVLLDFVLSNPDPDLWGVDVEKGKATLNKATGQVEYATAIDKGEDTIGVKVGGEQVYIKIEDKALARALRHAWKDETGDLERAAVAVSGWYNTLLRNVLTRYNPPFALVNTIRDAQSGAVAALDELGAKGAKRFAFYYPKAVAASYRGERGWGRSLFQNPVMDKYFEEFKNSGAITGGFFMKDLGDIASDMRTDMLQYGAAPKNLSERAKASIPWFLGSKVLRALEFMGSVSENTTRFALYMAARDSGRTPSEAALLAKNGTTNFNRKGEWGGTLNALYLFFNAAVQGNAQLFKTLKNPKVRTALSVVAGVGVAAAMFGASGGGDDDDGQAYWDKIPDYEKERNLIIMLPPGETLGNGVDRVGKYGRYIKIPVQYGLNFFPNIGYMMADVYRNYQDPTKGKTIAKATKHMLSVTFGSVNPFGGSVDVTDSVSVAMALAPTILDLPIMLGTERNSFGSPVAPSKFPGDTKPDSERMFASDINTVPANIAKALNEMGGGNEVKPGKILGVETSVTPGTIENLIRATTGGLGMFGVQSWDVAAGLLGDDGVRRKGLEPANWPAFNKVYGEVGANQNIRLAGERMREVRDVSKLIDDQLKSGIAPDISDDERKIFALSTVQETYQKEMTRLRKEEVAVLRSEEMTNEKKRLALDNIKAAQDALSAAVNRAYLKQLGPVKKGELEVSVTP